MQSLRKTIEYAEGSKTAIGHFNISDSNALWAIFSAASKLRVPIIIGLSEGERNFLGVRQAVALVRSIREEFNYPIYLNADHTYSFEKVKEAIDAGFDAVIFDGTKLPLEENIRITKQSVEYAKNVNPEILIEGELGYIGKSSKLLDTIPEGVVTDGDNLVKPEEAEEYIRNTGADMLAPAVGNLHGMFKNALNPDLDIERIKKIREMAGVPLVLHGGSGISDEDFKSAIKAGMSIVHVNTEIRLAYRKGIEKSLSENPDEVAPYRFLKPGVEAMEKIVEEKLKLFNSPN
jgi:fructose-bisphosphate aldolase, class II